MLKTDVLIIGAGAAGLMCAIEAGKRGRHVTLLDSANKPGKKILMSGGGRCNFTNLHISPEKYLSHNPHFCKSALKRYTQWDFIDKVKEHKIAYHEKNHGELFCTHKAKDILNMLLDECKTNKVNIQLNEYIQTIEKKEHLYHIKTKSKTYQATSLVVASGGLSIPSLGSSPFGYEVAKQFGLKVYPLSAALVPFTLHKKDLEQFSPLTGISQPSEVKHKEISFRENILFTHRGISGPAILQISSYWKPGDAIHIDLLPDVDLQEKLTQGRTKQPKLSIKHFLHQWIPMRLVENIAPKAILSTPLGQLSNQDLESVNITIKNFELKPNATEGYRTAEVTKGGVDCNQLSSKTMESLDHKGLYFIGEVMDITGWLGGYNFQWAWSSGWAAGQVV